MKIASPDDLRTDLIHETGNVYARINYHQTTRTTPQKGPPNIFLETAAVCPLRCPMCPTVAATERLKRDNGIMKIELFRHVLNQHVPDTLTLHFSGEPTVNRALCQMIGEAKCEYKVPFVKFNTGIPWPWDLDDKRAQVLPYIPRYRPESISSEEEWQEIKKSEPMPFAHAVLLSGIDLITFSMEVSPAAQAKYRVGVSYEDAVRRVRQALNIKKEYGPVLCPTRLEIQHLIARDVPLKDVQESLTFWYHVAVEEGYDVELDLEHLSLKGEEFGVHVAKMSTIGGTTPDFGGGRPAMSWCKMIYTTLLVFWDGTVAGCCTDHGGTLSKTQEWPNVWKAPLREIWLKDMEKLRGRHRKDGLQKGLDDFCITCLKNG
jgi:organic radical activating enzyme